MPRSHAAATPARRGAGKSQGIPGSTRPRRPARVHPSHRPANRRPRVGGPAREGHRARDRGVGRERSRHGRTARPPRPARGELHRARRPRTCRRGRRGDAQSREDRQDGRCDGAGAESPGTRPNAQGATCKSATATATSALKAARQSKQRPLIALSLLRVCRSAVSQETRTKQALRNATEAAELFQALGDAVGAWAGAVGDRVGTGQPRTCRRIEPVGERCPGAVPELRRPVRHRATRSTGSSFTKRISQSPLKLLNLALAELRSGRLCRASGCDHGQSRHHVLPARALPACAPPRAERRRNLSPHRRRSQPGRRIPLARGSGTCDGAPRQRTRARRGTGQAE